MKSMIPGVMAASLYLACAAPNFVLQAADEITYRAHLVSPGGDLRFGLVLHVEGNDVQAAYISNGTEQILIRDVALQSDQLILSFPHYNSQIVAQISSDRSSLEGKWTKIAGNKQTEMPFRATRITDEQIGRLDQASEAAASDFPGRWRAQFESSDDPAVGIFKANDGVIEGTFLTTTGDYRYLSGDVHEGKLRLATFDGTHAFLFDAMLLPDGSLAGNFWSGTTWNETWKAVRDENAALPDGFEQIHWVAQPEWRAIKLHDLEGRPATLNPTDAFGAATIISLFGSWCPNCHDEASYLAQLDRQYRERGLRIVGLAFEAAGEIERDAAQVKRYVDRHAIAFPVYLAGTSDKREAARLLGFIDQLKAFPTTIFLDRAGKIVAIYSGFAGPATGEEHEKLKARFDEIIRRTLESR